MNIHSHLKSRRCEIVAPISSRRLAADFPGWGSPDAAAFLLPIEPGMRGEIVSVESHGAAPYTRFGIRFDDGTTAHGIDPQTVGIFGGWGK